MFSFCAIICYSPLYNNRTIKILAIKIIIVYLQIYYSLFSYCLNDRIENEYKTVYEFTLHVLYFQSLN